MKTRGGYNIRLQGKPTKELIALSEPKILHLPLKTKRFSFTELHVKDGAHVAEGAVLASDPRNQNVPLIAPRGGIVNLKQVPGHVTIEKVEAESTSPQPKLPSLYEVPTGIEQKEKIVRTLLAKGAWQFFTDAYTARVPDPSKPPQAIIISTINLEPFSVRGDAQLETHFAEFAAALEKLQPLLEYQPVWMVFPAYQSELGKKMRDFARGKAWIEILEIERKYPFDNDTLLAKRLGLKAKDGPVWCVRTEGIIAVDSALNKDRAATTRMIAVGGASVAKPCHMKVPVGYPIASIMEQVGLTEPSRLVAGGVFTGIEMNGDEKGLDSESLSLNAIPLAYKREILAFTMPGFSKRSYSHTFASMLRPGYRERKPAIAYGELRACINCGFCVEVCPAGIIPSALHKAIYADDLEGCETLRPDLCVECGLCSFVCVSKLDLRKEIIEVKETIRKEAELLAEGAQE